MQTLVAEKIQLSMGRHDLDDITEKGAANYLVENLVVHYEYDDFAPEHHGNSIL
jgi:hypothetical protein